MASKENPFQSMSEIFQNMQMGMSNSILDREAMMKAHRRNMESLTEANKMAVEVMKSITTLQSQYIRKTFEDMSQIMKDFVQKPDLSKETINRQTQRVRDQVHGAFDHSATLSEIISKSQKDMFDRMYDCYAENASELTPEKKTTNRMKH